MVEMMQFIILGELNVSEKIKAIQKSRNSLWLFLDTTQNEHNKRFYLAK